MPEGGAQGPLADGYAPSVIGGLEVVEWKETTCGERIAQARRELSGRLWRDISATEMARMLEVDQSTVQRWENDTKTPSGENLAKLTQLLEKSADWIIRGPAHRPVLAIDRKAKPMGSKAFKAKGKESAEAKRRRGA